MPCELADGVLSFGEAYWDNAIPLPLKGSGAVSLTAVTSDGEHVVVRGSGAEIVLRGKATYVEQFFGVADA